ncbi:hypothetical protein CISIN_1g037882mg, partial [Citrus sinensis]
ENSVVIKTLGRNLGYRVINERLKRIWSSTMGFSIIDLANDYYLVHYRNEKDVEYALTEGPWTVIGHYLTVQQWSSDFDIATNKIDHIVAWIRLSGINIHFYYKTIIKIDYNIVATQRGKFAHIAGRIQKVEYENLPLICFYCGKFGHYKDACPDGGVTPLATELPIPCPDAVNRAIMVGEVSDWNESKFGSWMVVTRKPCPRRPLEMESPKIPVQDQHGSKIPVPSNKSITENINPNIHNRAQTFQPNSPTRAMQGMHVNPKVLTTSIPCATPDIPSSSMHCMHANPNNKVASPILIPVTLNPLHHSVVSFPNPPLQSSHFLPNHDHPSDDSLAQSFDRESPDDYRSNNLNTRLENLGELDSAVMGRDRFPLTDDDSSGFPDTIMDDEAEALGLSP